jgi:phenylacetate-coenzyme A ligase PaaK-like adenylate-forming protein
MNAIRLHQLIREAAEHVPFYRQHWKAAGIDLTRIYSAVHLEFLPVVRKADLLACPPEQRIDRRYIDQGYLDPQADHTTAKRRRARFWNALRDVGYVPGEKVMLIAEPAYTLRSLVLRWTYVDAKRGEADVFETYARVRPQVLYGPLTALVSLARRVRTTSEVQWRPKLVISTGGELTDAQRTLLESTFEARIADFYSTPELGLVAYAKPGMRGYNVLTKEFHLETLRAGNDGLERLIVTDLTGGAMPLIRFDTGHLVRRDLASAGKPIVHVSGYEAEAPKLTNGGYVSPYASPLEADGMTGINSIDDIGRALA